MVSKRCRKIISKEVRSAKKKGKRTKQGVAIGYSKARKAGCKIPKRKR